MTRLPFQNLPKGTESLAVDAAPPNSPVSHSDGACCSALRDSLRVWAWMRIGACTLAHREHLQH